MPFPASRNQALPISMLLAATLSTPSAIAEPKGKVSTTGEAQTLVIETRVTGSTEHPKVTYIIPWQGISQPINIVDQPLELTLPQFQPINPKAFQQQVREFSARQQTTSP